MPKYMVLLFVAVIVVVSGCSENASSQVTVKEVCAAVAKISTEYHLADNTSLQSGTGLACSFTGTQIAETEDPISIEVYDLAQHPTHVNFSTPGGVIKKKFKHHLRWKIIELSQTIGIDKQCISYVKTKIWKLYLIDEYCRGINIIKIILNKL